MGRRLTISETLYERLETETRQRGLDGIEQLLEERYAAAGAPAVRWMGGRAIDRLHQRLFATYGPADETVTLLRDALPR